MSYGPFEEKPPGAGGISATRTVAIMFAVVICWGIVVMARQGHLHEIGWPLAALGAVTLLAVPLQALFRAVTAWLQSSQGKALVEKLISKVAAQPLTIDAEPEAAPGAPGAPGAVTTTTTVNPPEGE